MKIAEILVTLNEEGKEDEECKLLHALDYPLTICYRTTRQALHRNIGAWPLGPCKEVI